MDFQNLRLRRILRLVWLAAVMAVIVCSLLPGSSRVKHAIDNWGFSDKLEHIVAYAVLSLIPALHERVRVQAYMFLGMMLMGIALEFGQLVAGGRSFEREDILADCVGLLAGLAVGFVLRFWMQRTRNTSRRLIQKTEILGKASLSERV